MQDNNGVYKYVIYIIAQIKKNVSSQRIKGYLFLVLKSSVEM